MTTFSFNENIPATNNNPSADQPIMQTNNASTKSIIGVDHLTFDSAGSGGAGASAGQHKQVTFNNKNAAGAQVDPISTLYTNSGTASGVADLFYRNQNTIFRPNIVKAWAFCNSAGAIVVSQFLNVTSVTRNSAGNYSVVLVANTVSTTNFGILLMQSSPFNASFIRANNYIITGVGTFDLFFYNNFLIGTDPTNFTFAVLQV